MIKPTAHLPTEVAR